MGDFLLHLFDTNDFPARWHCGNWSAGHGWLHIVSDLLVWAAYFTIPLLLIFFIRKRRDLPFSRIFLLFAAFILFCGLTHLIEATIFWWTAYRFAGVMKLATALVSWATVVALAPILPKALALRSPAQLEKEVELRTAQLAAANQALQEEIDERNRATALLRERREWFRVTLASIGDAVIVTDAAGAVAFMNPAAEHMTGWTSDEALHQPLPKIFQIIHEMTRAPAENPVERAMRKRAVVGLANHTLLVSRDGRETPIEDSAAPIFTEAGEVRGVVLVFHDTAERRDANRKLQQSEERLRLALDSGRMGVWDWNIRTNDLEWTGHLEEIHGFAPGTFNGRFESFLEVVHPEDRDYLQHSIQHSLETHSGFEIEFRNLRPNGALHWVAGKGGPLYDEQGRPARMVGVGMDVTARKQEEQAAQFLAQASAALVRLTDYESTLQKIAWLAVPSFADWCAIHFVEADGTLQRLAVAHTNPEKLRLKEELADRYPPGVVGVLGAEQVGRSGESRLVEHISEEFLREAAQDEAHFQGLHELGMQSYLGVPLKLRGQIFGVISFLTSDSGRSYNRVDLAMAEDLANRAAVAIENSRLYSELREADQRKDQFLAMLAHELRNPLAAIGNGLHLLRMPELPAEVLGEVRVTLERQFHHLVRMVDDLLDVSRVMRGKIELRPEPITLAEVVARAVETARPLIDAQRHTLEVELPSEPLLLHVDPVRFAQILANLLNNAAKYTDPGGRIVVAVAVADEKQVRISIRDNGIGISPEMLEEVFDLFTQTEHGLNRSQGGLGIGLTLVKRFVEMHGGKIEARSAGVGQGSEFLIQLPLEAVTPSDALPPPSLVDEAVEPHSILVVDDNTDAAQMLAMILRNNQHQVEVATHGVAALELVRTLRPQIVILDLGMPDLNGYEVARRVRSSPEGREILLVALTGWGGSEERRRTAEAGFDHHLVKPVRAEQLRQITARRTNQVK